MNTPTKNVLITGGNTGIGLETAIQLCKLNYNVIITARSDEKALNAIQNVKNIYKDAKIQYLLVQLDSFKSVKLLAENYLKKYNTLDILINNAGIMALPFKLTEDGIEEQFQVNHLSHFLLTHLLFPLLLKNGNARVINVASRAHLRWLNSFEEEKVLADAYDPWVCYGRSKCCNILFSRYLAAKFPYEKTKITFNSLHPGLVDTGLLVKANFNPPASLGKPLDVNDGALTSIFLATDPSVEGISGQYYFKCQIETNEITSLAQSDEEASKLWETSLKLCNITEFGKN